MPLVPSITVFPVYEQGEYKTRLEKVEVVERTPFGAADNAPKEDAYRFTFTAKEGEGKNEKDLQIDGKSVKFFVTTGTAYGSKKSTLTKTTNQMVGRALDMATEAPRFDYEKLVNLGFKLLVNKEPNNDGDMRNNIVGITAMQDMNISEFLIPA